MKPDNQFDLVRVEFELTQRQMDKYDGLLSQIKTWTMTAWAALSGWAFQSRTEEIIFLSVFVVLFFLFLDISNKSFRQSYKERRNEIASALKIFFQTGNFPENFISPNLPEHRPIKAIKYLFLPHVFLFYLPLIAISLLLYCLAF